MRPAKVELPRLSCLDWGWQFMAWQGRCTILMPACRVQAAKVGVAKTGCVCC